MSAVLGLRSLCGLNVHATSVRCTALLGRRTFLIRRVFRGGPGPDEKKSLNIPKKRPKYIAASKKKLEQPKIAPRPTLFTLTAPRPGQLTQDEFFSSLQNVASSLDLLKRHQTAETARTMVVLTTPSFATWIQDDSFQRKIVETLSEGCVKLKSVQTAVAVVDGLFPPSAPASKAAPGQSAEGFSFMMMSEDAIAAHREKVQAIFPGIATDSTSSSGLRFDFWKGGEKKRIRGVDEITVPLANTLFRNGRQSTLLVAKWAKQKEGSFAQTSADYKESYAVSMADFRLRSQACVPLIELTKPRKIVAGLGNIVRQLEGDNGESIPASTELEESVVSWLNMKKLPQQQVSVWALVVPEPQMEWYLSNSPPRNIVWDLISAADASLHRVLSGGGGWGIKAGLLSLDPENEMRGSRTDDDFTTFQERFADVGEQTQALGDIAKPGSYVLFLVGSDGLMDENGKQAVLSTDEMAYGLSPIEEGDEKDAYGKMALGCIRSTIDDMPISPADSQSISKEDGDQMQLSAQFSAQSERGLFVRLRRDLSALPARWRESGTPRAAMTTTKIDVPGAKFIAWHVASKI